jgi:hypothetical protein
MEQGVSGGGQRVVAELGQDVAGLPEDLAGLGQRGALAAGGRNWVRTSDPSLVRSESLLAKCRINLCIER